MNKEQFDYEQKIRQERDLAIMERNILALLLANVLNLDRRNNGCGYYYDNHNNTKVISMCNGQLTITVPRNFDTGKLPKIVKNHDGHTKKEMWKNVKSFLNIK